MTHQTSQTKWGLNCQVPFLEFEFSELTFKGASVAKPFSQRFLYIPNVERSPVLSLNVAILNPPHKEMRPLRPMLPRKTNE